MEEQQQHDDVALEGVKVVVDVVSNLEEQNQD
ncbi:hypothetical protein A2U01_0084919, partial [Trifolium medium]|nr:hypothetical protein [Trifolium medium]